MRQFYSTAEGRCEMQNYPIVRKRASATQIPFHRARHSSNTHPEDEPFLTDQRKHYPNNPLDLADDLDYPGVRTRMPSSAVRWRDTHGNQIIQQGNRRIVIHDDPPPKKRKNWTLPIGIGMVATVLLFVGLN